jgi:hypothetical protein
MRASLAFLAILLLAYSARCADADPKQLDEEFLRGYVAGEYDLIGRKADSAATYTGHVTLRDGGGVLQVMRTIEGKTDKCAARFDTVAGPITFPCSECIFILRARSTMPRTAGNLILTITRDLRATFILPTPNLLASKRFFQSTNDCNAFGTRRVAFDFTSKFSMFSHV